MILCGSGHRPHKLGGYSDEIYERLYELASWALERYTPSEVISGMALGWDQALADAAWHAGIPYTVALPFRGQELRWPQQSRKLYTFLVEHANNCVVVCEGGYEPWKMQRRNEWMVDHSGGVLALWDGSNGGTANCLRYAERQKIPVYNLWDLWQADVTELLVLPSI